MQHRMALRFVLLLALFLIVACAAIAVDAAAAGKKQPAGSGSEHAEKVPADANPNATWWSKVSAGAATAIYKAAKSAAEAGSELASSALHGSNVPPPAVASLIQRGVAQVTGAAGGVVGYLGDAAQAAAGKGLSVAGRVASQAVATAATYLSSTTVLNDAVAELDNAVKALPVWLPGKPLSDWFRWLAVREFLRGFFHSAWQGVTSMAGYIGTIGTGGVDVSSVGKYIASCFTGLFNGLFDLAFEGMHIARVVSADWLYSVRVVAIVVLLCAFRQLIMDAIRAVVRFLAMWWSGPQPRRERVRKSKELPVGRPL